MKAWTWIADRLRERSTWVGFTSFLTACGVYLWPDLVQAIITAGVGAGGLVYMIFAERGKAPPAAALLIAFLAFGAAGCTAEQKALINTGVQERKSFNDSKAALTLMATCDIAVGAFYRLPPITRSALSWICGGDGSVPASLNAGNGETLPLAPAPPKKAAPVAPVETAPGKAGALP